MTARPDPDRPPPDGRPAAPDAGPLYCLDGPVLCHVRVWTDAQWAALPAGRRPHRAEHVPGLGWVGAVPVEVLN